MGRAGSSVGPRLSPEERAWAELGLASAPGSLLRREPGAELGLASAPGSLLRREPGAELQHDYIHSIHGSKLGLHRLDIGYDTGIGYVTKCIPVTN